jgi:hypothetical protein
MKLVQERCNTIREMTKEAVVEEILASLKVVIRNAITLNLGPSRVSQRIIIKKDLPDILYHSLFENCGYLF